MYAVFETHARFTALSEEKVLNALVEGPLEASMGEVLEIH